MYDLLILGSGSTAFAAAIHAKDLGKTVVMTESQMATPVGAHDDKIAAHNALSKEPPRQVDHTVIPRTIFTDPQVAVVGLTSSI